MSWLASSSVRQHVAARDMMIRDDASATRNAHARASALQRASHLGITGTIGEPIQTLWRSAPSADETLALQLLSRAADQRVFSEHRTWGQLSTALTWLERFKSVFPNRVLFTQACDASQVSELQAAQYNDQTFELYQEFVRSSGKMRGEGEVTGRVVGQYASVLRAFVSKQTHMQLLDRRVHVRSRDQLRDMQWEDGPAGNRTLELGLRGEHLSALAVIPGFVQSNELRWRTLITSHNLLLRGGDAGLPDRTAFVPRLFALHGIAWKHVSFPRGRLVIGVIGCKDSNANRRRWPQTVPPRRALPDGRSDQLCAATATWRAFTSALTSGFFCAACCACVREPEHLCSTCGDKPLFAIPDGTPVRTTHVHTWVCEAAAALGLDPAKFGGKSCRIGGAEDLRSLVGTAAASRLLAERGRWCSEVKFIYGRPSLAEMGRVSRGLADVRDPDLESVIPGWIQPTR